MNIYKYEFRLRVGLLITALLIISATLWYTHLLANKLAAEERKRMQLLADAYERLNQSNENTDITFLLNIIEGNKTVPLILTNEKMEIQGQRNFDSTKEKSPIYLKEQLQAMSENGDSIGIRFNNKVIQYIFYKDSNLLIELKYFPYIQLLIIIIFLSVAYLAFFSSQRSVQNKLWVGMAKETAHQLATPLSSLSAWLEHLNLKITDEEIKENIIPEMNSDIERLEIITERFSKIGSAPELLTSEIVPTIHQIVDYMKRRASAKIQFNYQIQVPATKQIRFNSSLFNWVMENLLRNALDSMGSTGTIEISLTENSKQLLIDIKDTGKGIPKDQFKTVFQPGFSTKKRGWGLGLALCKRIIEEYHQGKIFVKESTQGAGTTFRIALNKD
jgi:signal transduction histidine kinase